MSGGKPDGDTPDLSAATPAPMPVVHHVAAPTAPVVPVAPTVPAAPAAAGAAPAAPADSSALTTVGGTLRVASGVTNHEGLGDASAAYSAFMQTKTGVEGVGTAYQQLKTGDVKDGLMTTAAAGTNLVSGAVGATNLLSKYVPKVADLTKDTNLSSLGPTLGYVGDAMSVTKAFVEGGPDKTVALQNAASTLEQVALTRAVVAVGGVTATAYIQLGNNAMDNYNTQQDAAKAMAAIKPDNKNQSNLRQVITQLAASTHPELKNLKTDAKGNVDLTNTANQTTIKAALTAQDKTLQATMDANSDQFVIPAPVVGNIHVHALDNLHGTQTGLLVDGARDPKAAQVAADAQVQQKRLEVGLGELDSASNTSQFVAVKRTAAQEHDDVVLARRGPNGGPPEENITVQASKFGVLTTEDTKQALPPEVLAAYKADPTHNLTADVPLYEKGTDGKPKLDAKGNPIVGKIVHYNIQVAGGQPAKPSANQWDMTNAEMQSAFGSTWAAERLYDAKDAVNTQQQKFDAARQALGKNNTDATRQAVVDAYTAYEQGLQGMVTNAKALGLDAAAVKQIQATRTQAGKDFQNAFGTPDPTVAKGGNSVTVTAAAPPPPPKTPPRRPAGGAAPG